MQKPIQVNSNPAPLALGAALRQIALVIGGWAIGKGFLDDDTLTAIITVATIAAPFIYGQIKGIREHAKLVTVAEAAPNRVAEVK